MSKSTFIVVLVDVVSIIIRKKGARLAVRARGQNGVVVILDFNYCSSNVMCIAGLGSSRAHTFFLSSGIQNTKEEELALAHFSIPFFSARQGTFQIQ